MTAKIIPSDDHIPGCSGLADEACNVTPRAGSDGVGFVCTRIDGHTGRHEAGVNGGRLVMYAWPQSKADRVAGSAP